MDLMNLKVPPDKAVKMANAIESHMLSGDAQGDTEELEVILKWLRFRIAKWHQSHPDNQAA